MSEEPAPSGTPRPNTGPKARKPHARKKPLPDYGKCGNAKCNRRKSRRENRYCINCDSFMRKQMARDGYLPAQHGNSRYDKYDRMARRGMGAVSPLSRALKLQRDMMQEGE